MKQILNIWILERQNKNCLSKKSISKISEGIIIIAKQLPYEFHRKLRDLSHFKRYKSTEFRQFILYISPMVLLNNLNSVLYVHFLKLHCALRILCNPKQCIIQNHVAKKLLHDFVIDFPKLYGAHTASYNVHSLLHLLDDAIFFNASLDDYSAFKFENFLQFMKKLPKGGNLSLQQIYCRYHEKLTHNSPLIFSNQYSCKYQNKLSEDGETYKSIYFNKCKFSRNDYVFNEETSQIIKIISIYNDDKMNFFFFNGVELLNVSPVYIAPLRSELIGIYETKFIKFSNIIYNYGFKNSIVKIFTFTFNGINYFQKFLH